jgi:hypothetical protein
MTNYVSYLLAANAAKRRLAELFDSETLDSEGYRSTAIVAGDRNRAARTNAEQNNNIARGYSSPQRWPAPASKRTVIPTKKSDQVKRDLTVSGLALALVFSGAVISAHTDRPAFWLLVGPTPFAVAYTVRTCLRQRLIRREGLLVFSERNPRYLN